MKNDSKPDTYAHTNKVHEFMNLMVIELMNRSLIHDASKLEEPELAVFDEFTPKLENSEYGSEEYQGFLKEMETALNHHYARNRHHPEHFADGINDMNLIDLVEMMCDWKAASLRHSDGNIRKSIETNVDRFNIDAQLKQILINTVSDFF